MKRLMLKPLLLGLLSAAVGAAGAVQAQQPPADVVLTNGKIITVDGKFTIAQAVAIRGDRFVAVGSNADITKLAGASTRLGAWLRGLLARAHANTAVVALAAKMARTVWALLRHGRVYEADAIAA